MAEPARLGILFETFQEFQILKRHLDRLSEWRIPYALTMASAWKSPERLTRWIREREREGVEVFVVAVGGAASLAAAVAALTCRPVIAVPLDTTHLRGQDALFALTELPADTPVAVVGINHVENAFHCALRLLAVAHPDYAARLEQFRAQAAEKEGASLDNLRDQYPEYFGARTSVEPVAEPAPVESAAPAAEEPPDTAAGSVSSAAPAPPAASAEGPRARRIVVNPLQPDVTAIEEVSDILLEGGIVALPTDTVYGLAAVATNGAAVERLYAIKGRERGKPIPILIHSTRGLSRLVREVPDAARALIETLWPGALTLVFRKPSGLFAGFTPPDTIGLRMPDHLVALAVMSMVARPLAVTSANESGRPPALTADEVLETFGSQIDCVLDAGKTPGEKVSTVLSLVERPFRILREGAVSFEQLKDLLGDALAEIPGR
ncbi:MAG: L-threonylcarbamoyladenylate synthase [Candidatus Sumerlaeia bacterium]|nr:L-threonylcarbamoyladenylate synthase [Candidatus Sumerlaeia bacterium]